MPESTINPLEPLEQLAHWMVTATVHLTLGLAIGMILARLMRGRHLHWSWAAGGLAVIVLARPVFVGAASTLGTAALCAAVRGRRWHREDIDAGADLAEIAAHRFGPLDGLRVVVRWTCARAPIARALRRWSAMPWIGSGFPREGASWGAEVSWGAGVSRGETTPAGKGSRSRRGHAARSDSWFRGGELILGRDARDRAISIPFGGATGDATGGTHTLVVGATGSGKTVTMTWITVRAIEHGLGAVVVDPKGDRGLRDSARSAAQAAGRPFLEWTPAGPSVFNPFARGSATEIADKVLAGERFTEPHYLRQAQRYLGHVVRALRKAEVEVSLQGIVDHLDAERLELLVRGLVESDAQSTHTYLDSLTQRQRSELAGVRDRLAILAESDVGPWLDPATAAAEHFDLLAAVRANAVVYFNLESDRLPLLTEMLGAAIVQDLQTTMATLQGRPVPTLIVIDEFSAIAAAHVVRLFGRARSAGFNLLLGTQELSDLRLPGRETLLDRVMGNLSVLIAHRQVVPASAELTVSLAGTEGVWKTTQSSDGRTTRTRARASLLDAGEIVSLARGWAAVLVLSDGRIARLTRIFSIQRHR